MRSMRRALVVMLTALLVSAATSAQTLRTVDEPRNLSPSVGMGGPEGGPTGLFTIYDGDNLTRGEYTFGSAYGNFENHRLTEVPLNFNVGVNERLELFFKTNALFNNRLQGTHAFTNYVFGAKWRLTEPHNRLRAGLLPFYRLWRDRAQGGQIGDLGLVGFVDTRLRRSVNLSVNAGYILNSNPRINLARPDELLLGVGLDFPLNSHFQPIAELRTTQYANSLRNNLWDVLGGVKIYPNRWWGLGLAYRSHLNLENGLIAQFWMGRRNPRATGLILNEPPIVTLSSSSRTITLPCTGAATSNTCTPSVSQSVQLTASATDPDYDALLYTYTTTAGRIIGEGPNVTWDLSGSQPGTYKVTVEVDDGLGLVAFSSTTVTVAECAVCLPSCPTITIDCPTQFIEPGETGTVSVNVSGVAPNQNLTYKWSVNGGTIISGQGTSSITLTPTAGQTTTATVDIGGLPPECEHTRSCSFIVDHAPSCRMFDSYGSVTFNDEKARLDNLAAQLQQEPGAQAIIVAYGSCEGEGMARASRAKGYLVNTRGIDSGRVIIVDGVCHAELTIELFMCPTGAPALTADASNAISPCPACKVKPHRRAPRSRRARRRSSRN